mmetsp:Transcript_57540/g.130382  ORF Transcript_57540/g.130382 Transcript_57540/m.130382 type:complete len:375 (-) Transcript_57540:296-1420(-)
MATFTLANPALFRAASSRACRLAPGRLSHARPFSSAAEAPEEAPAAPKAVPSEAEITAQRLRFNNDRAKWRGGLSVLRKGYAEEVALRKAYEAAKKLDEAAEIKRRKEVRMQEKLARSAQNAVRVEAERAVQRSKRDAYRAMTAEVRAKRDSEATARRQAAVGYLEAQAARWLTPERVDAELTADFVLEPASLLGWCEERSPYWGYQAQVERLDFPFNFEELPSPYGPASGGRDAGEAMALGSDLIFEHSTSYKEYKFVRESPQDTEDFIEIMKNLEVEQEDAMGNNSMRGLGGGFGGLGGGERRGFGFGSGRASIPQTKAPDESKLQEQIQRLRARRLRPLAPEAAEAADGAEAAEALESPDAAGEPPKKDEP